MLKREALIANMTGKPLTDKERERQEKLAARLIAEKNARKSKNVIQAGNQPSQWGHVVQNETRLIDNGHFMKYGKSDTRSREEKEKAILRDLEGEVKRQKREKRKAERGQEWKLIRRRGNTTEIIEKSEK